MNFFTQNFKSDLLSEKQPPEYMYDLLSIKNIIKKYDPTENYTYRSSLSFSSREYDEITYTPFNIKKIFLESRKKPVHNIYNIEVIDESEFVEINISSITLIL